MEGTLALELYDKILVPFDGSKPSINALKQAIQIGEALLNNQGKVVGVTAAVCLLLTSSWSSSTPVLLCLKDESQQTIPQRE
jgi:hypothetical protein